MPHPCLALLLAHAFRDGLVLVLGVGVLDLLEGGLVVLDDLRADLGDDGRLPVVEDALL